MRGWALAALLVGCARTPGPYFPPGKLHPDPEFEQLFARGYAAQLAAMREPSLANGRSEHVIRVLLSPSWGRPHSFRVVVGRRGGGVLVVRRASGTGGDEPGRLDRFRRVVLTRRQVARLLVLLEQIDLWALGPRLESAGGHDGTGVVLEVRREGRYHVVHSSDPPELQAVVRLLWRYGRLRR